MPDAKYARREKAQPVEVMHEAELVERPKKALIEPKQEKTIESHRKQLEALAGLKNEVFELSMGVLRDHLKFRDIDPYQKMEESAVFKEMCEEHGEEEATKMYRLAEAGWRTAANAPVGIKNAMNTAIGIMKANATEKGGTRILNVDKVFIDNSLVPQFEERTIEDDR